MAINLVLALDLSVDDSSSTDDVSSSGRRYLSDYICKGFEEEIQNNGLSHEHVITRGSKYEWSPDIPKDFLSHAKHDIGFAVPRQTAVTFETREFLITGSGTRSRHKLELPVKSTLELSLVAHLLVHHSLSIEQREKLAEGLRGYSQDPDDDLQRYVVDFVSSNVEVFGEDFSHELYLIDVGCIIEKTGERVRTDAVDVLTTTLAQRMTYPNGSQPKPFKVLEYNPRRTRKRSAFPSMPMRHDGDVVIEDPYWDDNDGLPAPGSRPDPSIEDDLDNLIADAVADFIDEESIFAEANGCQVVAAREEHKAVATLLSWPQFKIVWERASIRIGCVTFHIRVPKLKRRTAFKKLYVALATHFEVEDWLWNVLYKCATSSAIGASVLGLITANPGVAVAAFEAQFKACVWERLQREVFDCLSETIFIGTVHSTWKPV
jgi:hypothetical protein